MNDLISRQAVINALEKEKPTPFVNEDGSIDPFGAGRQNQWYRDGIAIMNLPSAQSETCAYWDRESNFCALHRPSAQPTVDVKPVQHGHWIRNDNGTYSCSKCQSWIPNEQHYYARYCLYCGAKMDEEKENESNL